jgi:hypothetical protein
MWWPPTWIFVAGCRCDDHIHRSPRRLIRIFYSQPKPSHLWVCFPHKNLILRFYFVFLIRMECFRRHHGWTAVTSCLDMCWRAWTL